MCTLVQYYWCLSKKRWRCTHSQDDCGNGIRQGKASLAQTLSLNFQPPGWGGEQFLLVKLLIVLHCDGSQGSWHPTQPMKALVGLCPELRLWGEAESGGFPVGSGSMSHSRDLLSVAQGSEYEGGLGRGVWGAHPSSSSPGPFSGIWDAKRRDGSALPAPIPWSLSGQHSEEKEVQF